MPKELRTAFISYTGRGDAAVAERLRTLLADNGIRPWQDRTQLRGGDDFWRRIEVAIRRCSHLVKVVTPDAFSEERRVLRREWYTARSAGTCVVPVKGSTDLRLDSEALPRWLKSRHIVDLDHADEVTALVEQLRSACTIERVPFMAADLPQNFTARTIPTEAAVERLLSGEQDNVAVTTALRGAGGSGRRCLRKRSATTTV